MSNISKEFKALSDEFAPLMAKYKEMQACCEPCPTNECKCEHNCHEKIMSVYQSVGYMIENLSRRMDWISENFWKHTENHVPALKTASQMEAFLDAVGMSNDVEVRKPVIYVNASAKNGPTLTLNYKKS